MPENSETVNASFKDPGGRVFERRGKIFRELTPRGKKIWTDLEQSGLLKKLTEKGWLVQTHESNEPAPTSTSVLVLEHERIPFVSFSYEWSPSLLKKAALLHLDLLDFLIPQGYILKDATPFNVQFLGVRPVYIDILSIEKLKAGDPWVGYGQFCDTMLYPLMLYAYKNFPYHDWLRGSVQGIPPEAMSTLFGWKDVFKKGVLSHIKLRAYLHNKFQDPSKVKRSDIQKSNFQPEMILRNVAGLRSVIENLPLEDKKQSHWIEYAELNSYEQQQMTDKKQFVEQALQNQKSKLILDLGCNTGDYSRLAAQYADLVVSLDNDLGVVERFGKTCEKEDLKNILPLYLDLCNPSPAIGWASSERPAFFERGKPDFLLTLALVHHLTVKGNIPLEDQCQFFSENARNVILEFVDRNDPMFQQLMTNVDNDHSTYNESYLRKTIPRYFELVSEQKISSSRILFHLKSKGDFDNESVQTEPAKEELKI